MCTPEAAAAAGHLSAMPMHVSPTSHMRQQNWKRRAGTLQPLWQTLRQLLMLIQVKTLQTFCWQWGSRPIWLRVRWKQLLAIIQWLFQCYLICRPCDDKSDFNSFFA